MSCYSPSIFLAWRVVRYILLIFILSLTVSVKAQGKLKILNKRYEPGDMIEFTYSNDKLAGFIQAQAWMIEPSNQFNRLVDISVYRDESGWRGSFRLMEDACAFFIGIHDEYGRYDTNGGKGYYYAVLDNNGEPVKGALAARASQLTQHNFFDVEPDLPLAISFYEHEFSRYPDLINHNLSGYLTGIDESDSLSRKRLLSRSDSLNEVRHMIDDEELLWEISFVYTFMKYRSKRDELNAYIMDRFPNGRMAITRKAGEIYMPTNFMTSREEGMKHYDSLLMYCESKLRELNLEDYISGERMLEKDNRAQIRKIDDLLHTYWFYRAFALGKMVRYYVEDNMLEDWIREVQSFDYLFAKIASAKRLANYALVNHQYQQETIELFDDLEYEAISVIGSERNFLESSMYTPMSELERRRMERLVKIKMMKADLYIDLNKKKNAFEELMEIVAVSNLKFEKYNLQVYQRLERIDRKDEIEELKAEVEARGLQKVKYEERIAIINGEEFSLDSVKYKNPRTLTANTGMKAPGFELEGESGNVMRLKDYKGKVIVLDFWATWCRPCLDVFPHFSELEQEYNDQEVVFFAINVDSRQSFKENIKRKFIDEKDLDLTLLFDWDQETYRSYDVTTLPTTIIIDSNGKIKFRKVGYDGNSIDYLQQMRELIEQSK